MRLPALNRPDIAQTTAVALLTVTALMGLSVVAAYWTWAWLTPSPKQSAMVVELVAESNNSASVLFGVADAPTLAPASGLGIRLLGIVAATPGRRGYAVLQIAKQVAAVREGDEIAPGIRLVEVATDHLTLERAGNRETLEWTPSGPPVPKLTP